MNDMQDRCPQCNTGLGIGDGPRTCPACLLELGLSDSPSSTDDLPDRIDDFRVRSLLGEGGMGRVYLAAQEHPVQRDVALKVIKLGMDSRAILARFERERQALALMEHAHIAKVFDAGVTERGQPYFAMEYVRGEAIDRYCRSQRLDASGRIELFLRVCEAVQHAHQKGVLHRDLKPSNVLVAEIDGVATPKVIDFGLAKATGDVLSQSGTGTRTGQVLGTPRYMSPEQRRSEEVDTRSDIYSLGLILYELLTDREPPEEPDELPRPSRVAAAGKVKALRGDLDWIVLKATEKEPARRYGSPGELAADLKRHLLHEPVTAGPPSATYRIKKFARRHAVLFGSGVAFVVLLAVFAVSMAIQANRVARERDRANLEAATAEQVSEFLVGLFRVADPSEARGETVTAREILDSGSERVRIELAEQPVVRARMMGTMGRVYQNLGLFGNARPLLEEALEIRRGSDDPAGLVRGLDDLAWFLENAGEYDAAEALYREALKVQAESSGDRSLETAEAMNDLGLLLYRMDRLDEAEAFLRRALEIRRELLAADAAEISDSYSNLGNLAARRGEHGEAESLHRQALEIRRALVGDTHPAIAIHLDNIGRALYELDDLDGAEDYFRQGLELRRRLFGNEHPEVAQSLNNLASIRYSREDLAGAAEMFREVVEIDRVVLGPDHPDAAQSAGNLAFILMKLERFDEAERYHSEALNGLEASLDADHWRIAIARVHYGQCLLAMKRFEEAEAMLLAGHRGLAASLGEDHSRVANAARLLVELYEAQGRPADADPFRRPEE